MSDNKVDLVTSNSSPSFFPPHGQFGEICVSLNLLRPEDFKSIQSRQIAEDDTLASLEDNEGEVIDVEVGKRLDIVAAAIIADYLFKLFDIFCCTIDYIVSWLVVITCHEEVLRELNLAQSLTIVQESKWWS